MVILSLLQMNGLISEIKWKQISQAKKNNNNKRNNNILDKL